jgi:hypothetical protein
MILLRIYRTKSVGMQPAAAPAPTVEVLVRQPRHEAVDCDECGHAQPTTNVEEWDDGDAEQQKCESVSVHEDSDPPRLGPCDNPL